VERSDSAASPALRKLLLEDAPSPAAVAALRLLDHFDGIESPQLEQALQHEAPMVRETAVTLVESRIATQPGLIEGLLALADDPDARVRFQTALALGESRDSRSLTALAMIAARDGRDRWTRAAVLSSVAGRERALLSRLLKTSPSAGTMETGPLLFDLGRIVGASCQPDQFTNLVTQLVQEVRSQKPAVRIALVSGTWNGLRPRLKANDRDSVLGLFGWTEQELEPSPPASAPELLNQAVSIARNPNTSLESRLHAIPLLALLEAGQSVELLTGLIDHREPASVQTTAIETLGGIDSDLVTRELLAPDRWRSLTPAARERALTELTSRRHHVTRLLDGIAQGRPAIHFLNAAQRRRLLNHPEPEIRARARQLLDAPAPADRMAALEDSKAALRLHPHPANGRAVFLRACASCHRLDREGTVFGPDLFDVRNQSRESLLLHLVVPEHEIAPGYAGYTVETTDGRTLSGIIVAETASGITLRQPLGVEETLLRERIARIDADDLSLMPQELEKSMTLQELADLLAWLKGGN
jgi:putative heme-binding domain-containing protein